MDKEIKNTYSPDLEDPSLQVHEAPLEAVPKTRWERSWPVLAAGSGLFSDGYLNGVRDQLPFLDFLNLLTHCRCR